MKTGIRAFLIFSLIIFHLSSIAQKRVHFSELEIQANGKYYQVNTIPPFTGTAFEVHPPQNDKQKEKAKNDYEAYLRSAQVREEVSFKEGKPGGLARGFDEFGQKVYEANFVDGVQQGVEKQWYPSGKLKLQAPYTDGKPNGMVTYFWENGKKKNEGVFANGYEDGLHTWWFEAGGKDQEIPFDNGKINGTVRIWFQDGTLKLESNYQNELRQGSTKEYYSNGQIKASGSFKDDAEEGLFQSWARTGKLLDEKIYKNGELIEARDFRNGGLRTKDGFIQVFNEMGTSYRVEVFGESVKTVPSRDISFIVDGKVLQLLNIPVESLEATGTIPEELLTVARINEVGNAEKDLQLKLEVNSAFQTDENGRSLHSWYFEVPESARKKSETRTVLEEHYLAVLVNDQILLLSSLVTDKDRPEQITAFLRKVASSIEIAEGMINLNAVREAALENK